MRPLYFLCPDPEGTQEVNKSLEKVSDQEAKAGKAICEEMGSIPIDKDCGSLAAQIRGALRDACVQVALFTVTKDIAKDPGKLRKSMLKAFANMSIFCDFCCSFCAQHTAGSNGFTFCKDQWAVTGNTCLPLAGTITHEASHIAGAEDPGPAGSTPPAIDAYKVEKAYFPKAGGGKK